MTDSTQPQTETLASKYENMGVHERATAMADDCVGDPWELLGYFREKLRQSERDAELARDAATRAVQRAAALTRRAGGDAIPAGQGRDAALIAELRNPWESLPENLGLKRGECPQWACDLMQRAADRIATPKPPAPTKETGED